MRPLLSIFLLAVVFSARAAEPPTWPLWDGAESVEQYARRAGAEPTRTLDLGNGVKMEMVLIPVGKFVMGTEEPRPVDGAAFVTSIWIGQVAVAVSGGVLLVFLAVIVIRAIRKKQKPQYSLARFVAIIAVLGVGVLGGMHWRESVRAFAEAKAEYKAARAGCMKQDECEKPAHEVTLTQPYYLGRFEVTQEQYEQIMGTNPSQFKGRDHPVEQVSWDDAQEFCKKLSEKMGLTVRLPTEAEWEHACRAGTRTAYYIGDREADLDRAAWYDKNVSSGTHSVGLKVPNAWGLCDMHGSVWEWCSDWYGHYGTATAMDPQGATDGDERVFRGGCWHNDPGFCRSASRLWSLPFSSGCDLGFRVAASVPPKAP